MNVTDLLEFCCGCMQCRNLMELALCGVVSVILQFCCVVQWLFLGSVEELIHVLPAGASAFH